MAGEAVEVGISELQIYLVCITNHHRQFGSLTEHS